MIQLVVNVNLLRELDERKLINTYARYVCNTEEDLSNDNQIKNNLIELFDWDKNGDNGLGIYCSHFEDIKTKDWEFLINFIKENRYEIKNISYSPAKIKRLESIKVINDALETKKQHNIERFTNENYEVSGRGKKAKPCIFEGRKYKSQQECLYKEKLTKNQLYNYLKSTGQI